MVQPQVGERVGNYTLLQKLGHGGMSDVYRARDEHQPRDVVLKFPHADMLGDPATYERFRREVKIGKILTHPHIQKLYELGGEQQSPFLVFEYVDGQTLREVLRERHRLPEAMVIDIGTQLATALAYAHANHVFHRDLKPENIVVTATGAAKVMDFGIGFVAGARRITWGSLSSQIGTPDYMAPEQIKGVRGDARTDVYALGTILYECIAGRVPYRGDNPLAVMNQHVTVSARPIHDFNQHVTPALQEVIMKAIRRNIEQRWPSMDLLREALQHLDTIDAAALMAEREAQEQDLQGGTILNDFGRPLWQVALIVIAILLAIIAVGVIAQLMHHI